MHPQPDVTYPRLRAESPSHLKLCHAVGSPPSNDQLTPVTSCGAPRREASGSDGSPSDCSKGSICSADEAQFGIPSSVNQGILGDPATPQGMASQLSSVPNTTAAKAVLHGNSDCVTIEDVPVRVTIGRQLSQDGKTYHQSHPSPRLKLPSAQIPSLPSKHEEEQMEADGWRPTSRLVIHDMKLIVNYIPTSATESDLKALFCRAGPVNRVTLVRSKENGHFGFGFVTFATKEGAKNALEMFEGYEWGGKKLKVSPSRPQSDKIKGANLYIRNIPPSYSEVQVYDLFSPYGSIIHVKILGPATSADIRRSGFVRYDTRTEAEAAVASLHNTVVEGSRVPLSVTFATQKKGAEASNVKQHGAVDTHHGTAQHTQRYTDQTGSSATETPPDAGVFQSESFPDYRSELPRTNDTLNMFWPPQTQTPQSGFPLVGSYPGSDTATLKGAAPRMACPTHGEEMGANNDRQNLPAAHRRSAADCIFTRGSLDSPSARAGKLASQSAGIHATRAPTCYPMTEDFMERDHWRQSPLLFDGSPAASPKLQLGTIISPLGSPVGSPLHSPLHSPMGSDFLMRSPLHSPHSPMGSDFLLHPPIHSPHSTMASDYPLHSPAHSPMGSDFGGSSGPSLYALSDAYASPQSCGSPNASFSDSSLAGLPPPRLAYPQWSPDHTVSQMSLAGYREQQDLGASSRVVIGSPRAPTSPPRNQINWLHGTDPTAMGYALPALAFDDNGSKPLHQGMPFHPNPTLQPDVWRRPNGEHAVGSPDEHSMNMQQQMYLAQLNYNAAAAALEQQVRQRVQLRQAQENQNIAYQYDPIVGLYRTSPGRELGHAASSPNPPKTRVTMLQSKEIKKAAASSQPSAYEIPGSNAQSPSIPEVMPTTQCEVCQQAVSNTRWDGACRHPMCAHCFILWKQDGSGKCPICFYLVQDPQEQGYERCSDADEDECPAGANKYGESECDSNGESRSITIFVHNFGRDKEDRHMLRLFGEHARILSVDIIKNPRTGRHKGYAFVKVANETGASRLIQKFNGFEWEGRTIGVERKKKPKPTPPVSRQTQLLPEAAQAQDSFLGYPGQPQLLVHPGYPPYGLYSPHALMYAQLSAAAAGNNAANLNYLSLSQGERPPPKTKQTENLIRSGLHLFPSKQN